MHIQFQYSNLILFLLTQVFCLMSHSEVYLPPPSLSCYLVNPLIPNTALPFPHTRSRFNPWSPGGAAHVWVVIWRSSPSDFPYKQPQIVRSLVVPVELGGLHSPSIHPVARAAHTVHFLALLNQSM